MVAVGAFVDETVEEVDHVGVVLGEFLPRVVLLECFLPLRAGHALVDHLQDLDFVVGGLQIVGGGLLYLEGHVVIVFKVLGEPDGAEMAPAELLDDHVSVEDDFADVHGVVAASIRWVPSNLVVLDALVLLIEVVLLLLLFVLDLVRGQLQVVVGGGGRGHPLLDFVFLLLGLLLGRGLFGRLLLDHFKIIARQQGFFSPYIHKQSVNIVFAADVLVRAFVLPLLHLDRRVVDLVTPADCR